MEQHGHEHEGEQRSLHGEVGDWEKKPPGPFDVYDSLCRQVQNAMTGKYPKQSMRTACMVSIEASASCIASLRRSLVVISG